MIDEIEGVIGLKCSELKSESFKRVVSIIKNKIDSFVTANEMNEYYIHLLKKKMEKYLYNPNLTNIKECLKQYNVYGTLSAYRFFCVGCSRARKNLVITIN